MLLCTVSMRYSTFLDVLSFVDLRRFLHEPLSIILRTSWTVTPLRVESTSCSYLHPQCLTHCRHSIFNEQRVEGVCGIIIVIIHLSLQALIWRCYKMGDFPSSRLVEIPWTVTSPPCSPLLQTVSSWHFSPHCSSTCRSEGSAKVA